MNIQVLEQLSDINLENVSISLWQLIARRAHHASKKNTKQSRNRSKITAITQEF